MPEIVNSFPILAFWGAIGYLLGSIPFGVVLTRLMGLGDLRQIGSGNIGATNVLRTGNKLAAAGTLVLDGLKGAIAVLLARFFAGEDAAQLAALLAFVGHCFPVWLKFRGGKGVATFIGILLALAWPVGLLVCATWAFGAAISRMSSVGALTAAMSCTVWAFFMARIDILVLATILTGLVYWRHSENLARIKAGTEPRIGQKN